MVEDYVPDRIEFDLSAKDKLIKANTPVELKADGHFLYGAPASGLALEGDMAVRYWFAARRLGFAIRADGTIVPLAGAVSGRLKRVAHGASAP